MIGKKPGRPRANRAKGPRFLGGKLFGGSPTYDRVLEEGDPDDFELSDISDGGRLSDSSNASWFEPRGTV